MTSSPAARSRAGELADKIEAELRRVGVWTDDAPPPDVATSGAFGGTAAPFVRWVQWVLIERLRSVARGELDVPSSSSVATYAVRELDGQYEFDGLRRLLHEVDHLPEV